MEISEIHFESIDSTSAFAKREYKEFAKEALTVISADEQTAGRGRYQRKWLSPKGVNLYATFCFRLPSATQNITSLAIIGAYSVAALLQHEGLRPSIKWPNDVQLNGKKVSGVLCETIFEGKDAQILLGIGLNVNMDREDLEMIDQPATSLRAETEREWNRRGLLKQLQIRFASDLQQFKNEGFASFRDTVNKLLAYKGKEIRCFDGKREWRGICDSLAADGHLNLRLDDGTIHPIYAGDTDLT